MVERARARGKRDSDTRQPIAARDATRVAERALKGVRE
jgi:tmRNA-binding protein